MAVEKRLVGRDSTLAVLEAALDDAWYGHGQLMLITGEPGIGKSALVTAATESAARRGAQVLWAQCWDGRSGVLAVDATAPGWPSSGAAGGAR